MIIGLRFKSNFELNSFPYFTKPGSIFQYSERFKLEISGSKSVSTSLSISFFTRGCQERGVLSNVLDSSYWGTFHLTDVHGWNLEYLVSNHFYTIERWYFTSWHFERRKLWKWLGYQSNKTVKYLGIFALGQQVISCSCLLFPAATRNNKYCTIL